MQLQEEISRLTRQHFDRAPDQCDDHQLYQALLILARQRAQARPAPTGDRKLYYFSAEFLLGKLLSNQLLALGLYLARYDHEGFKRYMTYVGVAFFTVIALYLLFPNRQDLRVTQFPRDNLFTRLVALVYSQDTNTNVCPSLHVVGSMAVCFAAWNCRRLRKPWMQGAIWAFAFLVAVSTVFVKQHSALDLILAVPFSLVVYPVVYRLIFRRSGVESPVRRSASEPAT